CIVILLFVDVIELRGEGVRVGDVLVLRIKGKVLVAVRGGGGVQVVRIDVDNQPIGAQHQQVRTPFLVVGEAPVGVVSLQIFHPSLDVRWQSLAQDGERAIGSAVERNL